MTDVNVWQQILADIQALVAPEDFRRWFAATAYASDSVDHIMVWVPSEGIRRHIELHYAQDLQRALGAIGRPDASIRFVVAGFGEEDEG